MEEAKFESLYISGSGLTQDKMLELFINAIKDGKIRQQQLSRDYQKAWENNWAKMLEDFRRNTTIKPLISPDNIHPFFNYALNYCNLKGQILLVFQYLKILSKSYSNFHAANAFVNMCINRLCTEKENSDLNASTIIQEGCEVALQAATIHLTPGYILSAMMHFFVGQYFRERDMSRALQQFSLCRQQLLMAEALEVYSEKQIIDCYRGEGIRASNSWDCESIQALKSRFTALVDPSLLNISKIQEIVDQDVEELKKQLETDPRETTGITPMEFN